MWSCSSCRKKAKVRSDTCPKCGRWHTLVYEGGPELDAAAAAAAEEAAAKAASGPKMIDDVSTVEIQRISTGLEHWDFAFCGGMVPGDTLLFAGEAGVGKTTSMLTVSTNVAHAMGGRALYLCSEMLETKLREYVTRAGCRRDNLLVWYVTQLEDAVDQIKKLKPKAIVIDSMQMFRARHYGAGTEHAIKLVASEFSRVGKELGAVTILLSQVNKDKWAAVPETIGHLVDVICYLEPTRFVIDKNRSGIAPRVAPRQIPGMTPNKVLPFKTPKGA